MPARIRSNRQARHLCGVLLLLIIPAARAESQQPSTSDNVVLRWNQVLLHAVRAERFAPTLTARALAITHTCMYDAWAAYDAVAAGVHWTVSLRQPVDGRSAPNEAEAISFAAYAALVDLFPAQIEYLNAVLSSLGYAAQGPAGELGVAACNAVLEHRHRDGSNQLGDLHPGAYSDYTGYVAVNPPDAVYDPNRWQPLLTPTGQQQFLTPHWGLVLPFAITDLEALRPDPPPLYAHGGYREEANQLLHFSARLDGTSKMIAEYWADGPATETPPGHWALFAQAVSRRDQHSVDDDVKMFFALSNALLDASIAVWDCKRTYDFVRPITAIRFLYGGRPIRAWAGPGLGTALIDGALFRSYVATPPFPEYVSGHSTFSAASAEILRLFSGSDVFVASVRQPAGSSAIEPGLTPAQPVTLTWTSFSEAADQAGLSRRYGGIHFESGDLAGRALGRTVGRLVWDKVQSYFNGSAAHLW
jgi:hypothetical protein